MKRIYGLAPTCVSAKKFNTPKFGSFHTYIICIALLALQPDQELPTDLPFILEADANDLDEEDKKSGISAGLIGGIVGAIIAVGLLTLLGVVLAKQFGCLCAGAGGTAAAAAGANDDIYESPVVIPIVGKKGMYDAGKGPGYTDLAFDNNVYSSSPVEMISGVPPEPPAYSEADPVDSPYSDIVLTPPPMYDNFETVPEKSPSAPAEYDNLAKSSDTPAEYDNLNEVATPEKKEKVKNFENKTYELSGPSPDDIIGAKNALKPTGTQLD